MTWASTASAWRGKRLWLACFIIAWGILAIVTQSLLLREALVLMFGSELAWGVVLFAWLLGVAVGAGVGGWVGPRKTRTDVALVGVLLTLSAVTCLELWVFRGARVWIGVDPGELVSLPKAALAALLFITPAGALVGAAFPLACCVAGGRDGASVRGTAREQWHAGVGPLGGVYAFESLGSLIGGAAFSFWAVEHLAPIETALICGAMMAAASGGLLAASGARRAVVGCLAALAAGVLLVCFLFGDTLDRGLVLRRWRNVAPGYELCAETESKYQNLALGRRAGQFSLYSDGHVSVDFPDPYTSVPLAHFWMCQHAAPRRVLILGGGAEGLLSEVLKHPIEHVDCVEPDPRLRELIEPYLEDADRRALTHAKVTVHHLDARHFVKTQRDRFDLIIGRFPEPTSALRARYYTDEFYRELRRAMTARSVLCLSAAAAPADLPTASADYLASIRATLRRHFPHVIIAWGDPAQVLAATADGLITADPAELAARYARRGVQSRLFHPLWFDGATDWLNAEKLRARSGQLDAAQDVEISTDLRPAIYMRRLALWERMAGGETGRVVGWLRSIGWAELAAISGLIMVATLGVCRLRARPTERMSVSGFNPWAPGAVVLSVGTTGFATMALSIIWLFAFQSLYGFVYQRIGWIIALFMGGLVIGCSAVSLCAKRAESLRRVRGAYRESELTAYLWQRLVAVDVLIALLALFVPFVLPALGTLQDAELSLALVEWIVSILVTATGVLGGAAFALAGGLQLASTGHAGTAAGSVVGADHAGACAGALLTGILLVPVFGTAEAAILLVGLKLVSAAFLFVVGRPSRAA